MKRLAVILGFICTYVYGQDFDYGQKDYVYKGKTYKAYTSLEDAAKVNPDSVFCLVLKSKRYKNFPKEVLKYKNLVILDLSAFDDDEMYGMMSKKEKRKVDKHRRKLGDVLYFPHCYHPSAIFDIPIMEVKELKKLIYLNVDCCYRKVAILCELQKMTSNLEINPDVENSMYNVTGKECKCR